MALFFSGAALACMMAEQYLGTGSGTSAPQRSSLDSRVLTATLKQKWHGGQNPDAVLFSDGEVGFIQNPRIVQIIDRDTTLISTVLDDRLVLLKGFPNSGYVDDERVHQCLAVKVLGRTTYKTVLGGSRTTFVLQYLSEFDVPYR